ncbi:DUF302 domain-containing protein [Halobacillus salinarum]|uniref:DUF302 domain-containing protein n=1 Tax=Halobacillus salinarum TaxID=2932257 RepID=A0ABY4EHT2_9BACI|nr:DUF302 domain-containing protein [Halobacillus salinarum]UOQ43681.1 DUF302 domain-containing protein [Halobacillus salinarum]
MFHYTVESNRSLEETVTSLEDSLKQDQFGVLWHFDIKETLNNKGLDFNQPYRVLEVCNPEEAERVLSENQLVGYFLPCKIVVYEDNGSIKIGMPKPTALIEMVNDPELQKLAANIEQRLITAIDNSL